MGYRVAVIGGGQLARMMAGPAEALQVEVRALVEAPDSAAAQVLPGNRVGLPAEAGAVESLVEDADVLTFEHEHVSGDLLRELAARGVSVQPGPDALVAAQDKIVMRTLLGEAGVPVPRWRAATSAAEVRDFAAEAGWPVVVKTPTGGYDGKGVLVLDGDRDSGDDDSAADWRLLEQWLATDRGEVLVEEHVPFRRELAALSARRPSGQFLAWPVVETIQAGGVCSEVLFPAPGLSESLDCAARDIAHTVATTLGVTGVLAVELFETTDGRLLVNELAMRPHNSGHVTIEACRTSQFEQHLRAVLDLPLGATQPVAEHAVMVNLLGSALADPRAAYPELMRRYPDAKVHLYGKSVRPGRKLGHVTITGPDPERCLARARAAVALLRGEGN